MPFADVLYSCDARWWEHHKGCPDFAGEKWSSHGGAKTDDKTATAEKFGLNLIAGRSRDGFSLDPGVIHYGGNSGFQAVNLAIIFGATRIILIGFDMQGTHFFGPHTGGLRNTNSFAGFIRAFAYAAKRLPAHVEVINCTPNSALTCFKKASLDDAIESAFSECRGAGRFALSA